MSRLLLDFLVSVAGSLTGIAIYMHYDLEGWFLQRRIKKGQKQDEKLREQAQKGKEAQVQLLANEFRSNELADNEAVLVEYGDRT